ncbi:MAG: NADPH-dependent 7-cyano-7-deazaguanine reductase QueF [Desulfobulbaceae bacterium]|nr:NADPH-dependent 7-cyano-7-deazaguanine reductase QueF [Desulfobulbaceae bacterium]
MTEKNPLGRTTAYPEQYSPGLLYAIARTGNREALGLGADLPFHGTDIWNAWELTWLDNDGLPQVGTAVLRVPASSPKIIESKSLKLYLNSFAMTRCASIGDVAETIEQDLSGAADTDVAVRLQRPAETDASAVAQLPGDSLDDQQISCDTYEVDATLLSANADDIVHEDLNSHLLRSLCPVTSQSDTASLLVSYTGPRIDHAGLLRYIVSYRQHQDFHETCVERMFLDILERCKPEKLTVYARYQRRGGIDINPFRSNHETDPPNLRLWRQ